MKNFTQELKDILKEDPGVPILSPEEVRGRANTMVILTNQAPPKLLALAGSSRRAILLNYKPLMITFPDQKGVYKVQPDDIVFENHHTGRDVTEAGAEETSYEKFFASAMKKFGVASPIELSPDDTKKFFDYVDKNWDAEEESDGSQSEGGWEDPPRLGGEPSLITPMEGDGSKTEILPALARGAMAVGKIAGKLGGDDNEDVSTGKVGKKDKGSYQHAYKLALKKYQIHSADELDTPEERKGFTSYVDRLWKKGDIHRDKKEAAVDEVSSEEKARRKVAVGKETKRRAKAQSDKLKKRVTGSEKTTAERDRKKLDAERERRQEAIKRKAKQEKEKAATDQQQAARDKEREREQDSREREREQQQATREKTRDLEKDNGDKDDDKADKKKSGTGLFKGLAGIVKQAADKEKTFVGR